MLKRLPIDVSTFAEIISENYLYIDKTEHIYALVTQGKYYFISRPRRFGKSLLMSTLSELFKGNRALFKDLWIGTSDYQWTEYPVIYLDFSNLKISTSEEFETTLSLMVDEIGAAYNIDLSLYPYAQTKIGALIKKLSTPNKVVVLIDEYDYPIINNLHNVPVAEANRNIIKGFFATLKSLDAHLRAIFITGVTRFAKTSVFSGMNNVRDITIDPRVATLLGCTDAEIDRYLADYIEDLAKDLNCSTESLRQKIKEWYNGYRFTRAYVKVYNLFSLFYLFDNKIFANYWFQSGTPSFLVELMKREPEKITTFDSVILGPESLGNFTLEDIELDTILFQTGYLTINDYNEKRDQYTLGFPNKEVKESFDKYLLVAFLNTSANKVDSLRNKLINALDDNDIAEFCSVLTTLFANIPYQLHQPLEKYYHSLLQLTCSLLGMAATSEVSTNKGRIDLVLTTSTHLYVFELKFKDTAQKALDQILERKYYQKYLHQGKEITLVGLALNEGASGTPPELTWVTVPCPPQ